MKKVIRIVCIIFLGFITIMMPIISYDSWKEQQAFSKGDKGKTEAIIKVDEHKVKTYNYKENGYGVDAEKSAWRDGDKVTVYYLKDKPDMVAENPYVYHTKREIFAPLMWFILLGIAVITEFYVRYLTKKIELEIGCDADD
ncbi:hypothetical protein [Vagococcus hydrophili]|uniref:hypothetical protein n=1 Tax=Vagococcus hydrophili TaxID=2714947 RepID=UPI0019329A71|nr:hypothetical protein [Vagococcus hydrophili]